MKAKVYVETSVVSYLTSKPNRDLIVAAHQQVTAQWWARRERFELYVSEAVFVESSRGDAEAARRRTAALADIAVLATGSHVEALAAELVRACALPPNATVDALHIALAAANGMDYLVTWNCAHIANAAMRGRIEAACRRLGYSPPVICTPEELLEGPP